MIVPLDDLRYEIKFVVPITESYRLTAWVREHTAAFGIAYPPRRVNNVYYDSYGLATYEENLSGVSERTKIRLRWYGADSERLSGKLELKMKRNRLGWKKHLYYARRNAAPVSSPGKKQIPPELAERIAEHSYADAELVRFVRDLLAQEIEVQGAQFRRQVEKMHRVNHRIFLVHSRWTRSPLRKVRNLPVIGRAYRLARRAIERVA